MEGSEWFYVLSSTTTKLGDNHKLTWIFFIVDPNPYIATPVQLKKCVREVIHSNSLSVPNCVDEKYTKGTMIILRCAASGSLQKVVSALGRKRGHLCISRDKQVVSPILEMECLKTYLKLQHRCKRKYPFEKGYFYLTFCSLRTTDEWLVIAV